VYDFALPSGGYWEEDSFQQIPEPEEMPKKKRFETSKLIVWVCLINGFL